MLDKDMKKSAGFAFL